MVRSVDSLILAFDKALRVLFVPERDVPTSPARELPEVDMSSDERRLAGALMRVNHVGEICAQALYQGQAAVCVEAKVRSALLTAADDETDHLAWTAQRIRELGAHKSYLNPLWFAGAAAIGVMAGRMGDSWSLGFVMETERQVGDHLGRHLRRLPSADAKSLAIVAQMRGDELRHAEMAQMLGARELPLAAKFLMRLAGRVMTGTAHYV